MFEIAGGILLAVICIVLCIALLPAIGRLIGGLLLGALLMGVMGFIGWLIYLFGEAAGGGWAAFVVITIVLIFGYRDKLKWLFTRS